MLFLGRISCQIEDTTDEPPTGNKGGDQNGDSTEENQNKVRVHGPRKLRDLFRKVSATAKDNSKSTN